VKDIVQHIVRLVVVGTLQGKKNNLT